MSFVAAAIVTAGVATAGAGIYAANAQSQASQDAASAQSDAAQKGIDEQKRQFDATQKLLAPYVGAGNKSLSGQQDLLGLNGPDAQAAAIQAIQNGPQFQSLYQQGEDAILQNASATGGLRGGNTQASLANFRPQLLNQLIGEQYSRLAGVSGLGQASAAGQAAMGQQNANSISNLLGQQGAAQAGAALAQGQYAANTANAVTQGFTTALPGIVQILGSQVGGGAF